MESRKIDRCFLVNDDVGKYLAQEIAKRKGDATLEPIYTYPMNGLPELIDKPLQRPKEDTPS